MRLLQILLIAAATLGLVVALQLPDRAPDPAGGFAGLADADWRSLAESHWQAGRRGAAVEILNYAIEHKLPGWLVSTGLRDTYRTALLAETNTLGRLLSLGIEVEPEPDNGLFASLAGRSVADALIRADMANLVAETGKAAHPLVARIAASQSLAAVFPQADLAFALLKAAVCSGAIQPALENQMADILAAGSAADAQPMSLAAAQDSLMPVYQLARVCKTWTEFAALLSQARSQDQLKAIVAVAASGQDSAARLTRILLAGGSESPRAASRAMDVILQRGAVGLELAYRAAAKGPDGLAWLDRNPGIDASGLEAPAPSSLSESALARHWLAFLSAWGSKALIVKYLAVALLCTLLLVALIPVMKNRVAPATGGRGTYWLVASAVGLTIGLLLIIGTLGSGGARTEPPADTGALTAGGPPAGRRSGEPMDASAIAIMVAGILIVQGICWVVAHRRIRDVETDTASDRPTRLKRMENLDTFLDLPLYAGLAVTIFSFILITTYGVGVARFLAYSSTLIGILLSVMLRLFYIYPLRERLITEKE